MLLGPLTAVALLLVAAGVAKLRRPTVTQASLAGLGLPATPLMARTLGFVEVVLGAASLAIGSRPVVAAACVLWLALAATTVALLRKPDVPCGCFGADDAPATTMGLAVDVGCAALALAATVAPPGSLTSQLGAEPVAAGVTLCVGALLAWLLAGLHRAAPVLVVPTANARTR